MTQILWHPSPEVIQKANLTRFMDKIRLDQNVSIANYDDLYAFSLHEPEKFWKAVWSFCDVIATDQGHRVLIEGNTIETAKFFPDASLNFAENLLRRRDEAIAITFYGEDRVVSPL